MSTIVKTLRAISVGVTSHLPAPWQPRLPVRTETTALEERAVRVAVDMILGAARNPGTGSGASVALSVLRNAVALEAARA